MIYCNHIWVRRYVRGHDEVHCALCYQCLGVDRMLRAYTMLHGGSIEGEKVPTIDLTRSEARQLRDALSKILGDGAGR